MTRTLPYVYSGMNPCPETVYTCSHSVVLKFLAVLKMASLTVLNKKELEMRRIETAFGHYQVHTRQFFLDSNVSVEFTNGLTL